MSFTTIPAIVSICYVCIEAIKTTKLPSAWYPVVSMILGTIFGVAAFFVLPAYIPADSVGMALILGAASGLAATGTNQVYQQLFKKE